MALEHAEVRELYRRRAPRYDLTANLYYLIGFREFAYRKEAVAALDLRRGDTVVELGCGTGLNFRYLQDAIGPEGEIIGVDLTDAMLAEARERVERRGWQNVKLARGDMTTFPIPRGVDGIISTFALSLVPDFEEVMRRAADALRPGGKLVVLDLRFPDRAPRWLVPAAILATRAFGANREAIERRPWEALPRLFSEVEVEDRYLGFSYIAVAANPSGRKPESR